MFSLSRHTMCLFMASAPVWCAPFYHVRAVGPAGAPSSAVAINNGGVVVGNYQLPDGSYQVYVWQNGAVNPLEGPGGATNTKGLGINDAGQISGYADLSTGPQALLWSNFSAPTVLGPGYALGINSKGEVAGMKIQGDGSGAAHLFRPFGDDTLGDVAGGGWSAAVDVNDSGTVAGKAMTSSGTFRAFTRDAAGAVTLLQPLGGANSYAHALNASGAVAGSAQTASGALMAVIWQGTSVTALGGLGGTNNSAYGINATGTVVGTADLAGNGGTAAFVFDNGQMYDLNTRVRAGTGWRLLEAFGINDSGQIVGRGVYDGIEQAFLLSPVQSAAFAEPENVPEPKTLFLMGAALMCLALLRNTPKQD